MDVKMNLKFNQNVNSLEEGEKIHLAIDPTAIKLLDSEDENSKRAQIRFLQSGWNSNDYFFSDNNLDEVLTLAENKKKIYLDHDFFGFGRSEKDYAATFEKTWKADGGLYGNIRFTANPNTVWLFNEMKVDPESVQFSIDIQAVVEDKDKPDGGNGRNVVKVLNYRSTDIVSYAAAGGKGIKVLNEQLADSINKINNFIHNNKKESDDMNEIKNVRDLASEFPGLVEEIKNSVKQEFEKSSEFASIQLELTETKETLASTETELEDSKQKNVTLLEENETLKTEKAAVEKERDDMKIKNDEYEVKEKAAQRETEIQTAIKEAELDEKLVTDVFMGQLRSAKDNEEVTKLIEDRKGLVPSPTIKNGETGNKKEDETEEVVLSDEELIHGIVN
jgi:hypothetical protein